MSCTNVELESDSMPYFPGDILLSISGLPSLYHPLKPIFSQSSDIYLDSYRPGIIVQLLIEEIDKYHLCDFTIYLFPTIVFLSKSVK